MTHPKNEAFRLSIGGFGYCDTQNGSDVNYYTEDGRSFNVIKDLFFEPCDPPEYVRSALAGLAQSEATHNKVSEPVVGFEEVRRMFKNFAWDLYWNSVYEDIEKAEDDDAREKVINEFIAEFFDAELDAVSTQGAIQNEASARL